MAVLVLPCPARRPWAWLRLLFASRDPPEAGEVDASVLARARQGDHRAFAQIVDRHDRQLRALAYRLLGDRDRMDDALQEAYVKAFRALPSFKGDSTLGTWLHRITYNACMDEIRRERRVLPLADDADDGRETVSPLPGPAELVAERQELADALAGLPVDQRAAVLLVDAYGFDYDEAAEILSVRRGTIASRLNRARTALRATLGTGAA